MGAVGERQEWQLSSVCGSIATGDTNTLKYMAARGSKKLDEKKRAEAARFQKLCLRQSKKKSLEAGS